MHGQIAVMLIAILILIILLSFWCMALTYLYISQQQLFKQLTAGISKNDLKTILQKVTKNQQALAKHGKELETSLANLDQHSQQHLQKIGFIRFNPYSDTGGNQSFSICLLDNHNNGLLITSLHGREQTRIYAKSITNGQSHDDFFEEEKQALKKALAKS